MASLSSIKQSVFSASNENTVALANLKFDFSLVKVEAPAEFRGLGSALSFARRHNAESGAPHRTARRLGAMFEHLIPSTPSLITAYGKRVSQIIKTPGVNPQGSPAHGPFQSFVGAEGTALWAAATSGIPAIGIYLLACLLVRAWDAKESTAIWVELVEVRRRAIEEAVHSNELVSEGSIIAASQEISRQELRIWDASVRAWLRSADEAKGQKQTQMLLISRNVRIPYESGPSTYDKVLEVWKEAMIGMERLVLGQPQMITTRSIILALSAWHLYPDLVVLGSTPTSVTFKDDLIPRTGVATIGIQSSDHEPLQWSLALSHLQYYGGPVHVESVKDSSRVTMNQLYMIILGSLFFNWGLRIPELESGVHWFHELGEMLRRADLGRNRDIMLARFEWILHLAGAADAVIEFLNVEDAEPIQLLKHGHRRAKDFLSDGSGSAPFFGLSNPCTVAGLKKNLDIESGIAYLRQLAQELKLQPSECVISYIENDGYSHAYATAIPYHREILEHTKTGNDSDSQAAHVRWFIPRPPKALKNPNEPLYFSDIEAAKSRGAPLEEVSIYIGSDAPFVRGNDNEGRLIWKNPPPPYQRMHGSEAGRICLSKHHTSNSSCTNPSSCSSYTEFRLNAGSWDLGLYINILRSDGLMSGDDFGYEAKKAVSIAHRLSLAELKDLRHERLLDYLSTISYPAERMLKLDLQSGIGVRMMARQIARSERPLDTNVFTSLQAMSLAYSLYRNLEGATISLKILKEAVHKASWVPKRIEVSKSPWMEPSIRSRYAPIFEPVAALKSLSRAQTLACIAYLDSGRYSPHPKDLEQTLAICLENSIYVAGVVLTDPFFQGQPSDVRRIVGNIGRTGISMLVAPKAPRIRTLGDSFNVVNHRPYDSKREDNFRGTSLHLSFTDWTLPLETQATRTIDSQISYVESVISVRDHGEWVADLDILSIRFEDLLRIETDEHCLHHNSEGIHDSSLSLVSLDSWEELLDRPEEGIGILRANENWAARLAAVSVLTQQGLGKKLVLAGSKTKYCLHCLTAKFPNPRSCNKKPKRSIPLFCID